MRSTIASTMRPEVLEGIGGFGGLFAIDDREEKSPILVASTDGVGTKLLVARATGRYSTVGLDLVAMCVDDLVCTGAEPLFLLDYIATGRVVPERVADIVQGIAEGCRRAGCALLGGETAEHPDGMAPDDLDVAGFAVGVVDRERLLGPDRVSPGDVLVGLHSPGLRSNGYSLARQVLLDRAQLDLDGPAWNGADRSLADELLLPSRIYAPAVGQVLREVPDAVHSVAHITGGGIPGNLPRALPDACGAEIDGNSWRVPRIFVEIHQLGQVDELEMARVFNLGIGMTLVVAQHDVDAVLQTLQAAGERAMPIGHVVAGDRDIRWKETVQWSKEMERP